MDRWAEEAGTCQEEAAARTEPRGLLCAVLCGAADSGDRPVAAGRPLLSAGSSAFPGVSVSFALQSTPHVAYTVFLYCMEIKVYKHMVLSQQGCLGPPAPLATASPGTQS